MADWAGLPKDLVELIANCLDEPEDFLKFCAVCCSWRSIYLEKRWNPCHRIPWLMLNACNENGVLVRRFFSLSKSKIYKLPLSEAHGCRFWGSANEWIVTINHGFMIFLLNPVTRVWISLPPCCTLENSVVSKVDWFEIIYKASVFKIRGELMVVAIYGKQCQLAFARPRDKAWSTLQTTPRVSFCNITCFRNQIFVLSMVGSLFLLQTDGPHSPVVQPIAAPPLGEKGWDKIYLVQSSEELLLVFAYGDIHQMMKRFTIYKFDFNARSWTVVEELGDSVLLVDDEFCSSASASIRNKHNCVYFVADNLEYMLTSDRKFMGQIMVVYDLKDKRREFHCIDFHDYSSYTSPVWVMPTLW